MKVMSSAFEDGKPIPQRFSCEGENVSPPLQITDVPTEAQGLVIIMDDPDAPMGVFDHWIAWNIAPQVTAIDEGQQPEFQGINGFGRIGYGGPCPPPGPVHHYYFKVYALDTTLDLPQGATKGDAEAAMQGHIIEQAELVGTYQR